MIKTYNTCDMVFDNTDKILKKINKKKIFKLDRYFVKQKLSGLVLIAIGMLCPIFLNGDATCSVILIPLGISLIITRKYIIDF